MIPVIKPARLRYDFPGCIVTIKPESNYTLTMFLDGSTVPAVPEDTEEYRARAAALGYGSDVGAMSREHEILHNWLAEQSGKYASACLASVSIRPPGGLSDPWFGAMKATPEQLQEEESTVLNIQRWINTGVFDADYPAPFEITEEARAGLLAYLRAPEAPEAE